MLVPNTHLNGQSMMLRLSSAIQSEHSDWSAIRSFGRAQEVNNVLLACKGSQIGEAFLLLRVPYCNTDRHPNNAPEYLPHIERLDRRSPAQHELLLLLSCRPSFYLLTTITTTSTTSTASTAVNSDRTG